MKVTFKKLSEKPYRLYTIFLEPIDTLKILETPFHLITPVTIGGIKFQIFDRGELNDEPEFRLLPSDRSIYHMAVKTGFENNEQHLRYLIGLGEIPMKIDSKSIGGLVQFKEEF